MEQKQLRKRDEQKFNEWFGRSRNGWSLPETEPLPDGPYNPPPEAVWTGPLPPDSAAMPPQIIAFITILAFLALMVLGLSRHAPAVCTATIAVAAIVAFVRNSRKRNYLLSMLNYLDGDPSDTHMLVEITYVTGYGNDVPESWSDFGAMFIDRDFIAYSSPAVSFLLSGEDVREFGGTANTFASELASGWVVDIPLRVNPGAHLRIRTISQPQSLAKEFVRNLGTFKRVRPRTAEQRSLPPRFRPSK